MTTDPAAGSPEMYGLVGRERSDRSGSKVEAGGPDLTCLLVEGGARHVELALEIVSGADGICAGSDASVAGRRTVTALFRSVGDAVVAAAELARASPDRTGASDSDSPPGVRMALCTGEAGASPFRVGRTVWARAATLLGLAGPDQILTTSSTAVMAGQTLPPGTDLFSYGTCSLTPDAPPERIYELLVKRADHAVGDTVSSNLHWARRAIDGPLHGFDKQLAALDHAWEAACGGSWRMVLLSGEDGIDKTSIAAELALRLHVDGALVLYGRWDRVHYGPYQALREALGVYADGCSTRQLQVDLEGLGDEIARLLPDIGARVGGLPAAGASHCEHMRLFEAVESWLRALVTRRPTLLVLDELHWADRSSLLLLEHLWHARSTLPLLIVVAASTDDAQPYSGLDWLDLFGNYVEAGDFERILLDAS